MLYLAFVSPHEPAAAAPRHATLYTGATLPSNPALRETALGDKPPFYRRPLLTAQQRAAILAGYRQRLRSLASVDEAVGAIVNRLAALGILDDTYVIFTSDNGFKLGEHQLGVGKKTDFEQDIHVPLMVRGPGIRAGSGSDLLVGNVDYSPTFAAIAGAKPGRPQDGRSLLPVLSGTPPAAWRGVLPFRWGAGFPATGTAGAAAALPAATSPGYFPGVPVVSPPAYVGVRTARYLATRFKTGASQFYDLGSDPWELANKGGGTPDAFEQAYFKRALELGGCSGAACRQLEDQGLQ
jgi:N-acetylglucosamine-6-sulfatase